MPQAYEAMRDAFMGKGMNEKAAKTKAAKIYNSNAKKKGEPSLNAYLKVEKGK